MDISKIKVGDTSYDVKDAAARGAIESQETTVSAALNELQLQLYTTLNVAADAKETATLSSDALATAAALVYLNKKITYLQLAVDELQKQISNNN